MEKRPGLAARRKAVGLSQEGLAEALDTARSTVARWERGEVAPKPATRAPLAEILQISLDNLDHLLNGDEPEKTRDPVQVRPTEPVGPVHTERARDRVKQLLAMERTFGGTRIADLAVDSARAFERRMTDAGVRPGYRSEAHAVAAELFEISGWLLVDAARPADVDHANSRALHHAAVAGDHSMEIFVLQNESMHLCETGRATEALYLARGVLDQPLSPRLSAMFHMREARALAARGDHESRRVWQRAIAEYGAGVRDSDPYWSWWLDDEQMELQKALLLKDLDEHDLAIRAFREYLEARPYSLYCSLTLPNLALSQVLAGAWRDAEGTVRDIVDAADDSHSGRLNVRIVRLADTVKRSPAAPRSLRDAAHALAAFAG